MMHNDWTDKLPRLLEGLEEAEPEGLWDAVQAGLAPRKRRVAVWWYVAGVSLAAAAAVLLAVLLWKPSAAVSPVLEDRLVEEIVPVQPEMPEEPETPEAAQNEPILSALPPKTPVAAQKTLDLRASADETPASPTEMPETQTEMPATPPTETPAEAQNEPASKKVAPTETSGPKDWMGTQDPGTKTERRNGRLQLSVRSGGLLAQAAGSSMAGKGMSAYPATKANVLSPAVINRNRASQTDISHRQRFRVSAQAAYSFAPRWSCGTGLTYTELRSSLTTTSGNSSVQSYTTYSYLGVPLFVQFNAFEYKRLSLYLNAGGMYEVPIRAVTRQQTLAGSSVLEDISRDNPSIPGFQNGVWSLNAGVGVQWQLLRRMAVFVQPELAWHIPFEDAPDNFYSARPLAFDLNFGLRVLLF